MTAEAELEAAGEKLAQDLAAIFSKVPGLDDTPILRVHSWDWTEDGKTFAVYVDMPGGITRIFSFTPGEPLQIGDHGGMHELELDKGAA